MAPAPDEFPDFDSMSPEEQMAWLESLARRQGASADEFLTDADQDIPIPENVDIDEPGYVPYSIRESARMERGEEPPAEPGDTEPFGPEEEDEEDAAAPGAGLPDPREGIAQDAEETEAEEFPPVVEDVEFQADAFVTAPELTDPDDPSETGIADLEDEAADETLDDEDLTDPMTWLDSLTPQTPVADADFLAEIERAAETEDFTLDWDAGDDDSLPAPDAPVYDAAGAADFDELAELGLDGFQEIDLTEEARAAEDLNEPDTEASVGAAADSWLETFAERGTPDLAAEEVLPSEAETPQGIDEVAAGEPGDTDTGSEAEAVAEWSAEEMLGGADPIEWLETLARRQGAEAEELTTEADLDIPELPEDTVVDEPGYTEYSPFGILPPRREAGADEPALTPAEADQKDDTAAGLEALNESLGWLTDMTAEPDDELTAWLAVEDTFAERELRAEDESPNTDVTRTAEPEDAFAGMTDEEIELALRRGELTAEQELAWLHRVSQERAEQVSAEGEIESAEAGGEVEPAEPAELPPWVQAMREADTVEELPPEEVASLFETDESAAEVEEALTLDETSVTEAELAAFLEDEAALGETDALTGSLVAELEDEMAGQPDEPLLAEAEPIEMPDWLVEQDEEIGAESGLPAWLSEPVQPIDTPAEEIPDWLSELREQSAPAETAVAPEAVPEPEFIPPQHEAAIPEGELFNTYRQRLEEEPTDHATRLALARTLRGHGEVAPSLDHYETLIENAELLEDVSNDLTSLVQEQPRQPRARRLLGDTLMRQGRLQDALDAYRTALEQL